MVRLPLILSLNLSYDRFMTLTAKTVSTSLKRFSPGSCIHQRVPIIKHCRLGWPSMPVDPVPQMHLLCVLGDFSGNCKKQMENDSMEMELDN